MDASTDVAVRCVEGCSGDSTAAIIGLVVAGLSLAVALAAWKISQSSLGIARAEHQVFLDQLNQRADFNLDLVVAGAPDGVIETSNNDVRLKWQAGISNSGEKAARASTINFLVPGDLRELKWVLQDGREMPDPHMQHGPMSTAEQLPETGIPSSYLIREVERVSLRGSRVAFAEATIPAPANPGEERSVPASFRIESDDLPDDVQDQRVDYTVTIRRVEMKAL